MKSLFLTLFLLAGLAQAQLVTIAGQTSWGDTLKWGSSSDSTTYLLARGNAIFRDSASTWVAITTDSCSKPIRIERGGQRPVWKYEMEYEVRTSSGNTDSSQIVFRFDTRYCREPIGSSGCGPWVSQGRHEGYADVGIRDTVLTIATALGTTWKGTRQLLFVPGGNQIRACADGRQAGGATNDSTFFRRMILRYQ